MTPDTVPVKSPGHGIAEADHVKPIATPGQLPTAGPLTAKDYKGTLPPVWCPGCGDFAVLAAMQKALADLKIPPHEVAMVSGIGCSSRFPHFMNAYGFHAVHGRSLPVAVGLKLAMPDKLVIAVGGEGDGMAIGAGHFVHTARRNPKLVYVMMDNEIYGLTKGQASPTSELGLKTKTTPFSNAERSADQPINPLALAMISGATWVARAYSGKVKELTDLIKAAIAHEGYAFLQVISPCVTFHDIYEAAKANQRQLEPTHDRHDKFAALHAAMNDHWVTGLFYEEQRQTLGGAILKQQADAAPKKESGLSGLAQKILATAR
ncbi:MAG: 2-oxoglutarate/2-oxoacid ferredoxin oxidoreductase subunit beta [Thermoplasmata archaeon]|nr:2-oxoglutarate/2-oxoacid ferredoxin oxidoreductase subunit beta [Thermoplasmata archaeon]